MKAWSEQAEIRLREWLAERVEQEGLHGAEADEVAADLRRHVHEELEGSAFESVNLIALESVLERMGGAEREASGPLVEAAAERSPGWTGFKWFVVWAYGVWLPAGVILFEWVASFCGAVFFDPLPSVWHVLLAISVPAVNVGLLVVSKRRRLEAWWGGAAGFAWVAALAYGLLFLPLLPLSVIALIAWGLGVLSLTPIFAWLATWRIGRRAERECGARVWRRNWRIGALAALVACGVLEGPELWTRSQLGLAAGEGKSAEAALRRLRGFHSESALLRACYEGSRGTMMSTDIAGWVMRGWQIPAAMFGRGRIDQVDSEKMRDVFFRVTGKPFNQMKPPRSVRKGSFLRNNPANFDDLAWDDHLGGDQVAVRIRDLDLAESRFDGHVEPKSGLGYGEWTMVFRNGAPVQREARCQVRLPRGGKVSRLTLWINGEPREAAFAGVAKVKAAYQDIAVKQRRDPVLVTMSGPDTVLVQCFPVPGHGEMKIRFGVTAPIEGGRWAMPRIIERNFGLAEGLEHAVWLQSGDEFSLAGGDHRSARDGDGQSLAVSLPPLPKELSWGVVEVSGEVERPTVWCLDPFAGEGEKVLVAEPIRKRREAIDRCVVVVDGSVALDGWGERIAEAVEASVGPAELLVVFADDGARRVEAGELRDLRFTGGRDNEPALREAVRLAKEVERGAVVWLHGPQPVALGQAEAILQLLERGTRRPVIHAVALEAGPNRLAEALGKSGGLRCAPHMVDPGSELAKFLSELRSGKEIRSWNWSRQSGPQGPEGAGQVWDQLARWWAIEEVARTDEPVAAGKLAARYQLVTRVSGAVVLETAEQYAKHGLEPVDGEATPQLPSVPEPSVAWLVMVAALAAAFGRRR